MNKKYIFAATTLALISAFSVGCQNNSASPDSGREKAFSDVSKKMDKTDKESSNNEQQFRFKHNTFKTNKGSMTFNKVTNLAITSSDIDGNKSTDHILLFEVTFKNTSKSSLSPEDFYNEYLRAIEVKSKSDHDLGSTRTQFDSELRPWESKIDAALDKTKPGKTVQAVFCVDLNKDNGDDPTLRKLKIQPIDEENQNPIGSPLKLTVNTGNYTIQKDDNE